MFINTSNRFTNFYTNHKASIDTLLLLVQIIAIATALLGLLSLLGWALAISQVITWCNNLVADSLPPQRLLMPGTDVVAATDTTMPTADEILAEWQQRVAQLQISPLQPHAGVTFLQDLTIRELKRLASDRHISKYCNLTKAELILALN